MVKVYSRASCAPCQAVKAYLKNKKISYVEKNLDKDPDLINEVIKIVGYPIVPVIVIGNEFIAGLNYSALKSLLD